MRRAVRRVCRACREAVLFLCVCVVQKVFGMDATVFSSSSSSSSSMVVVVEVRRRRRRRGP